MPIEIERKFLVADASWRKAVTSSQFLRQAYFTSAESISVRVRIIDEESATLTVKLPKSGLSRFEFEQDIAMHEALTLMDLRAGGMIRKIRYKIVHAGSIWEIDEYQEENKGLVIAEIELKSEEQKYIRPAWLGAEVTGVSRYQNSVLAQRPFRSWQKQESLSGTV